MGRSSFESLSIPISGLFDELKEQGHTIIKIVMSNQWKTIPENYLQSGNVVILCHNWSEVKTSVSNLRLQGTIGLEN